MGYSVELWVCGTGDCVSERHSLTFVQKLIAPLIYSLSLSLTLMVLSHPHSYKFFPTLLFQLYMLGWTLGAIYSVPPFRTKRNPLAAGLTIATVRGFLLNFGVYYAVKDAIGAPFSWSPKVAFIARFMTAFATIIAITKDLPDVEGDKAFNISTFATKVGVAKIAKGASLCLFLNYLHAILTGVLTKKVGAFNLVPMVGGHALLATKLALHYRELEPEKLTSIKKYYKHIWDLFYLEYVLYTLI